MDSVEISILSSRPNYEHVYCLIEEIFEACITEADNTDLIENLGELYDSFNGQGFEKCFDEILLYVLSEGKRGTDATKILRFLSEGIVSLDNKYKLAAKKKGTTEDIDDIVHPLLKRIFKTLYSTAKSSNYIVRYRSCQLLYMIFTFIQDHGMGEIEMEIFENVANIIESRKFDASSLVRTHAVLVGKFFQDPSALNDPVIASLCWQMQHDPNYHVRKNIVSIIAACEETIMPIAKRFLYDKNEHVRHAALMHICKRIGPRSFTPSQRILILTQCFSDPSEVIRRSAEQNLIPVWFTASGDKMCSFYKLMRIGKDSLDSIPFMEDLTRILLRFVKIADIINEVGLDSSSRLPSLPLSGEKVFLWRQFFIYSRTDEKFFRFLSPLETLIPFIIKCLDDSSSEEVEECVFAELVLFLKDIMEASGINKCEEVFPMALNLMRHPFVSYDLMPYLVTLYLTYSPKDKDRVHNDILEVIEDLRKLMLLTQGHEEKILIKCFVIASQLLRDEETITSSIKEIKENLIMPHMNSDNSKVKLHAISTLTQYCLLDLKEAKLSWSYFENAIQMESGPERNALLEGAFDLLKCHGKGIFADISCDGQVELDDILTNMLTILEGDKEEQEILFKGILKLYIERQTSSPSILANLVVFLFQSNDYSSAHTVTEQFFVRFSSTKDGYNCLMKAFLTAVELLFDAQKTNPLYKINIKTAALQMLEIAKLNKTHYNSDEIKFQDSLILELTKKFIKKPWRLTAAELYSVCSHIIPENFDTLVTLKEHIMQVINSLQSSIFQQKNPFSKKVIKSFVSYQKKIQTVMNAAVTLEKSKRNTKSPAVSKRLEFNSSSSSIAGDNSLNSLKEIDVYSDTPAIEEADGEDNLLVTGPTAEKSCPNSSKLLKTPSSSKKVRSTPKNLSLNTPEMRTPSKTEPRKIATASRKKSARKTSSLTTTAEDGSPVFKTPAPRGNRKRQLEVTLTKTQ